jgi:hypothetical protein
MSKDYNNIIKEVMKAHDNLSSNSNSNNNNDDRLIREYISIQKEFTAIKHDIHSINNKIDYLIEIMNNLTIMVLEDEDLDDEDDGENYDSDQTWVPEEDNWLNNQYGEDDDEEL